MPLESILRVIQSHYIRLGQGVDEHVGGILGVLGVLKYGPPFRRFGYFCLYSGVLGMGFKHTGGLLPNIIF